MYVANKTIVTIEHFSCLLHDTIKINLRGAHLVISYISFSRKCLGTFTIHYYIQFIKDRIKLECALQP